MTERAVFLDRLRDRVAADTFEPRIPFAVVDGVPVPAFATPTTGVEGFEATWSALGGHVHHAASEDDVPAAVAAAVAGRGPVAIGANTLVRDLAGDLRWPACGLAELASAEVGVVGAVAAIAATGSIVVDAATGAGRSVSLLPPVAVFVVRLDTILATPSELFRNHRQRWPEGPPSQVVLVTGPSRSADIEMTLAVGVHGPGEVHAVLVA